jgi:hypothetical protein
MIGKTRRIFAPQFTQCKTRPGLLESTAHFFALLRTNEEKKHETDRSRANRADT